MSKSEDMFCGAGPVPKGKVRASAEYCVSTRQIRYYGVEALPEELLKGKEMVDIVKEQLKLRKLIDKSRILLNNFKKANLIINAPDAKPSQVKAAKKQIEKLKIDKEKMIVQIKKQKKFVDQLTNAKDEHDQRMAKKEKSSKTSSETSERSSKSSSSNKTTSKPSSKTIKSSGSSKSGKSSKSSGSIKSSGSSKSSKSSKSSGSSKSGKSSSKSSKSSKSSNKSRSRSRSSSRR